ncbi:hypothetical protein P8A21_00350 [Streptomyces poriferorum]|uniref:hypothetical protein n=1 Tax=Streptomyces poriferorum TaxID=2798799 RepID=UPI00273D7A8B|nr:hypothetical protein [Streptomyces sp. Alt1]WLQ46047.1 hypothetical protein P8A21_00350 [Streptomyces sp. Alt1]
MRAAAADSAPFAASMGTYPQLLAGPTEPGPGVDRVVIACRAFTGLLDARVPMPACLDQPPWRCFCLPTGHWTILSAPAELADILDAAFSYSAN